MLDETLLEIIGDDYGLDKHWQWLFRVEGSPIWAITSLFMTKEMFLNYVEEHNKMCLRHPIVEFGKAKITKRLFLNEPKS